VHFEEDGGREKIDLHFLQYPQEMELSAKSWVEDVGKLMKRKIGRGCL